jgi:hypothetical protein
MRTLSTCATKPAWCWHAAHDLAQLEAIELGLDSRTTIMLKVR